MVREYQDRVDKTELALDDRAAMRKFWLCIVGIFLLWALFFAGMVFGQQPRAGIDEKNGRGAVEETSDRKTREGDSSQVELGRKLFFDKALSAGGKVLCATCH